MREGDTAISSSARIAANDSPSLYVGGDCDLLRSAWPQIASHLLLRQGALLTLAESRVLGFVPALGYTMHRTRAKMFRSKSVSAEAIDYLYSELTLMEW